MFREVPAEPLSEEGTLGSGVVGQSEGGPWLFLALASYAGQPCLQGAQGAVYVLAVGDLENVDLSAQDGVDDPVIARPNLSQVGCRYDLL